MNMIKKFASALNNANAERRAYTLLPHPSTPWVTEPTKVNH